MQIDAKIVSFIKRHHVMTIATTDGSQPYCANLFYAWLPEEECFVFTSDHHTRHASEALKNCRVAASIVLETRIVGKIQGLQIAGEMVAVANDSPARKAYLKRFPYAAMADLSLWTLSPDFMKLTDNTLGFGKKLIWQRDGER